MGSQTAGRVKCLPSKSSRTRRSRHIPSQAAGRGHTVRSRAEGRDDASSTPADGSKGLLRPRCRPGQRYADVPTSAPRRTHRLKPPTARDGAEQPGMSTPQRSPPSRRTCGSVRKAGSAHKLSRYPVTRSRWGLGTPRFAGCWGSTARPSAASRAAVTMIADMIAPARRYGDYNTDGSLTPATRPRNRLSIPAEWACGPP